MKKNQKRKIVLKKKSKGRTSITEALAILKKEIGALMKLVNKTNKKSKGKK